MQIARGETRRLNGRPKWDEQAKHIARFFRNSSSACLFGWQTRRVFHVLFLCCCVLYTADWKLCVFHCFFPWIFRKNCMAVRRVARHLRPSLINCSLLLNCWLTFSPMNSYIHRSLSYQLLAQHGAASRRESHRHIRCMTSPFTTVRLIAFEKCISMHLFLTFFSPDLKIIPPSASVSAVFCLLRVVVPRCGDLFSRKRFLSSSIGNSRIC